MLFILVFLLLQQIGGNLIYPHVVGGSVGLPSIWSSCLQLPSAEILWELQGMLIFIPLASVCYTVFREVVYLRLRKTYKTGDSDSGGRIYRAGMDGCGKKLQEGAENDKRNGIPQGKSSILYPGQLYPLRAMRSEMPTSCSSAASGTLPDRFTLLRWLRNLL